MNTVHPEDAIEELAQHIAGELLKGKNVPVPGWHLGIAYNDREYDIDHAIQWAWDKHSDELNTAIEKWMAYAKNQGKNLRRLVAFSVSVLDATNIPYSIDAVTSMLAEHDYHEYRSALIEILCDDEPTTDPVRDVLRMALNELAKSIAIARIERATIFSNFGGAYELGK